MKNSKIKKISALIVTAAVIGTAMTGCTGSKRAAGTTSGSTSGTVALKDTFTYAQGADPRGLDPAYVDDGESAKVMCNIYEGLLKYNKNSTEVEPCLAKSYEISDDGMTYTFHLRTGVKFHDGTDFNADAVKATIDRMLEPNVSDDMPYASFVFGSIKAQSGVKEVKVVDQNTVQIILFSPQTPFIKNIAMVMAAPIVSPTALKNNNGNLNEHPVGTGPYKFVSWDKNQNIKLVRNDDYWGEKAKTKNIVFRFIGENSARDIALTSGEVDAIDGIGAADIPQLTSAGEKIFAADGMTINYMAYNVTSPKFKDVAARKAFSQAVNVPELVKSLYKEYATPATSIMPFFMNAGSKDVKATAFDKAAAKEGLAKAGITSVNMITYSNPRPYNMVGGQVLAEAIQGYLKEAGVTCKISTYDWTTYKSVVKKGDYDVCFYGWTGDNGDPDNFMNLLDDKDVSMNVSRYSNLDYHALILKGLETKPGADRDKIYTQLEQKAADDNVWLVISHSKNLAAYNSKVNGYYYHQTGVTPFAGVTVSK